MSVKNDSTSAELCFFGSAKRFLSLCALNPNEGSTLDKKKEIAFAVLALTFLSLASVNILSLMILFNPSFTSSGLSSSAGASSAGASSVGLASLSSGVSGPVLPGGKPNSSNWAIEVIANSSSDKFSR